MKNKQFKALITVLKSYNRKKIPVKYMGIGGIGIDQKTGFLTVSWTQLIDIDDKYGNTLEFYDDISECYVYDKLTNNYIFDGGY
jgi:hypothetical protein